MLPGAAASGEVLERSQRSWLESVVDANPALQFDVFAHSWSPEVGERIADM